MTKSQSLLAQYIDEGSEEAFRELVSSYVNLVYCTALRALNGNSAMAEEVSQLVFIHLARNAKSLSKESFIGGWLHRDTCFTAKKVLLREKRRVIRERRFTLMSPDPDHTAENLAALTPILDEAINLLRTEERKAIVARYFEQQDFRAVATMLGTTEDAARMRVNRSLEKLRGLLHRRGVSLSAAALVTGLGTASTSAAPTNLGIHLAKLVLTQSGLNTLSGANFLKLLTMIKYKALMAAVAVYVVLTLPLLIRSSFLSLQSERETAGQLQRKLGFLQSENVRLSNSAKIQIPTNVASHPNELLALRSEVGAIRQHSRELEQSNLFLEAQLKKLSKNSVAGNYLSSTEWSDKGNSTPMSAVETMLWATRSGQTGKLATVATAESIAERRWPIFPGEQLPIQSIGGVNLLSSTMNKDQDKAFVTAFVRKSFIAPPEGEPYWIDDLRGWQLVNTVDGWKITRILFFTY